MTKISNYYDHELNQFYDAMRLKLHIHRKKGKWEGANLETLLKLLVDEVEELRETIADGNQIALILEAADVANYAMIIANVAMKIAVGDNMENRGIKVAALPSNRIDQIAKIQAPHLNASEDKIRAAIGGGVSNV